MVWTCVPIFRSIWSPRNRENATPIKIGVRFDHFFHTNLRKSAWKGQLHRVISPQPLGVERQMSPFWKHQNKGYNMLKQRNFIFWSLTPPCPLNIEFEQKASGVRRGVQPQKIKILCFVMCSPSLGVSKMGSLFVSELQGVVEIWRNEVDPLAGLSIFFAFLEGFFGQFSARVA